MFSGVLQIDMSSTGKGVSYAVRMARLRARIFGELVRKTSKE